MATTPLRELRDLKPVIFWLLAVCTLTFWLTNGGLDQSEAEYHFQVARQIVSKGRLGFDREMNGIFTQAPNGVTYASHEIGNTLLNLPLAALCEGVIKGNDKRVELAGRVLRSVQAGLVMAMTLGLTFLIMVRHLGAEPRLAVLAILAMLVSSYVVHYGHDGFDGCLCALLWMTALFCHLEHLQRPSSRMLVMMAAVCGMAVITRISMVLPAGLLCVSALVTDWRRFSWRGVFSSVVLMGVTLLPFALWQMWYNHLRTGNVLTSPVQTAQYQMANGLDGNLVTGVTGLLFSPGKSLFLFAPLLMLTFAGWRPAWRRNPSLMIHVFSALMLWLLLHGRIRSWYGAWGWGPRYFITILPVLMLPLPLALKRVGRVPSLRVATVILIIGGAMLQGANIVSSYHYRLRHAENQGWLIDDDFIWNPVRNQVSDIVRSAMRNGQVMLGRLPPVEVQPSDPIGVWAANTLNHWTVRARLAGMPLLIILGALLANAGALAFAVVSLRRSLAATRSAG